MVTGDYGHDYLETALRFVKDEHQRAFGRPNQRQWTLFGCSKETAPQQTNGFDCGVYTCLYMDCTLQGLPFAASPTQVRGARAHITLSIIQGAAPPW